MSWGPSWFILREEYDTHARDIDHFVWTHRKFLVVVAAGNSIGGLFPEQVSGLQTARNCLVVGASEVRRNTYGNTREDVEDVTTFSHRGPTKAIDGVRGRIKPDVVAPGKHILSARSRQMDSNKVQELSRQGRLVGNDWVYMDGTSMAAPLVSGCAAILREALASKHNLTEPSADLLKALLINGTKDLCWKYPNQSWGLEPAPNSVQGFGRVNVRQSLKMVVSIDPVIGFQECGPALSQRSGATQKVTMEINEPFRHTRANTRLGRGMFKATLVYADTPSLITGLLQNKLNLIVKCLAEDTERHGNMGDRDVEELDEVSNVEKVVWEDPPGDLEIAVSVANLLDPDTEQTVALAWSWESEDVK